MPSARFNGFDWRAQCLVAQEWSAVAIPATANTIVAIINTFVAPFMSQPPLHLLTGPGANDISTLHIFVSSAQ